MCEHCMRPGNFDFAAPPAEKPADYGNRPAAVLVCKECGTKLERVSAEGYRCPTCAKPPWYQGMFIDYACPGCATRLEKVGPDLVCPKCRSVCRRP